MFILYVIQYTDLELLVKYSLTQPKHGWLRVKTAYSSAAVCLQIDSQRFICITIFNIRGGHIWCSYKKKERKKKKNSFDTKAK